MFGTKGLKIKRGLPKAEEGTVNIKSNYEKTKDERFREICYRQMFYDTEDIACYLVMSVQDPKKEDLLIKAQIATGNGDEKITITKENLERYETMDRALDHVDPHLFAAYTSVNIEVQALKAIVTELAVKAGVLSHKDLQQLVGGQD